MSERKVAVGWIDSIDASARDRPDEIAFTMIGGAREDLCRSDIARRSAGVAKLLLASGVTRGSVVACLLPNSLALVLTALAAWRLGATLLPLRWDLPEHESSRLIALGVPVVTVGAAHDPRAGITDDQVLATSADAPHLLDPVIASPPWLVASGGSSGSPKLIDPGGSTRSVTETAASRRPQFGPTHLVCTPLYHSLGLAQCFLRLVAGHRVVLMDKFDPARFLDTIENERINSFSIVPTMVLRLLRGGEIRSRDLSSLSTTLISAGATPEWAVREWIELIGKTRVHLGYGSSEGVVSAFIRGDDWLERPGSVGIPSAETLVIGDDGQRLPRGEVGELYFKVEGAGRTFRYLGDHPARSLGPEWVSVGDIGKLDEDGYLYIVDRRTDMIKTGGSNVFVSEVESALLSHPAVEDVAVVGLPDPDWGQRVHAIVQLRSGVEGDCSAESLRIHCKRLLAAYKAPTSFEFIAVLGRGEGGKLNRSALREARAT